MSATCIARIWTIGKDKPWKLCGRPSKGTTYMQGTVWTDGRGNPEAPACGIHLRQKYPPEWTGPQKEPYVEPEKRT